MSGEHSNSQWDFTQHLIGPQDEELVCLQAPSISARGWIPLMAAADQLPPSYFKEQWARSLALRELFRSGNDEPRSAFRGPGDFLQSLELKDFRSMLAIDEPKLYCARDGTPRLFTCWRAYQAGWTPMRGSNATWHSSGESTGHFRIDAVGREVMMDYWMRFRLSKFADLFGVAITGHSAPYASIRIILTMNSSGRANVRFRSSFIPSQHFYLGWELAGKYDMLKCAGQDFVGFVQAGKRQDASTGERFEIGLETKRVSLKGLS